MYSMTPQERYAHWLKNSRQIHEASDVNGELLNKYARKVVVNEACLASYHNLMTCGKDVYCTSCLFKDKQGCIHAYPLMPVGSEDPMRDGHKVMLTFMCLHCGFTEHHQTEFDRKNPPRTIEDLEHILAMRDKQAHDMREMMMAKGYMRGRDDIAQMQNELARAHREMVAAVSQTAMPPYTPGLADALARAQAKNPSLFEKLRQKYGL